MQFVADGPDIPLPVLQALEEGRLVLFCGAGISIPSDLPSFEGLVKKVGERLGAEKWSELEKQEMDRGNYDRVFGSLEQEGRYLPAQVRREVSKILKTPEEPRLETHKALLDLARDREGKIRLVTTNFDGLFEEADAEVPFSAAPLLPVPKPHKWDRLVYLHGRLDEQDPGGINLVLSSADFGLAYLVERWASRFVTELFRHFTVLFIGYGAQDPVMRYLIDALAAERRAEGPFRDAYAFAPHGETDQETIENEWRAKSIKPIPYSDADGHSVLHQTLKKWAAAWRGGLTSRLNIVTDLGAKTPTTPDEISRLCWAVGSGEAMAEAFAALGKNAPLDWLRHFESESLLGELGEPPEEQSPPAVPLVDHGNLTREPLVLDPVQRELAKWLAHHLGDPRLARWAIEKGGHLHPELKGAVQIQLRERERETIPEALAKIWRVLTGSIDLQGGVTEYERLDLGSRLRPEEPWSPVLRLDLLKALSPCLALKPGVHFAVRKKYGLTTAAEDAEMPVSAILDCACNLRAGDNTLNLLEDLRKRSDFDNVITNIARELTVLLHRALEMQAALDLVSVDHDLSYRHQPSIAPHQQNLHYTGWTHLVDLVREAFDVAKEGQLPLAEDLLRVWRCTPYPVFRRLFLYGVRVNSESDIDDVLRILVADPRRWLWDHSVCLELFQLLQDPEVWSRSSKNVVQNFLACVCEGPPRDMYRSDIEEQVLESIKDRAIWDILVRVKGVRPRLGPRGDALLEAISLRHQGWRLTGEESEGFAYWMEREKGGYPIGYSPEDLSSMDFEERFRALSEEVPAIEERLASWRKAVMQDSVLGLDHLNQLMDTGCQDSEVWRSSLTPFQYLCGSITIDQKLNLVGLVGRLPEVLLRDLVRTLVDIVLALAEHLDAGLRPDLLILWGRLLGFSSPMRVFDRKNRIEVAINHTSGILGRALFKILCSEHLERSQGIPEDVKPRLEELVRMEGEAGQLSRVIVASNLGLLHYLDRGWSREYLIPRFSWAVLDEAVGAWQGYLSALYIDAALWKDLKIDFLATFDHVGELHWYRRQLAALLVSVAIELPEGLALDEAKSCIRSLDNDGREEITLWLQKKLEGAEDSAADLWAERIGPWVKGAWPKETSYRESGSSEGLAAMALSAGKMFPDAIETVHELLTCIESGRRFMKQLKEKGYIATDPEASLELMNRLTGEHPPPWFGDLMGFLDDLNQSKPDFESDRRFQRLREIAIREGLTR